MRPVALVTCDVTKNNQVDSTADKMVAYAWGNMMGSVILIGIWVRIGTETGYSIIALFFVPRDRSLAELRLVFCLCQLPLLSGQRTTPILNTRCQSLKGSDM